MKKYRKLLPPAIGLVYTGLRLLGIEVPIAESELVDAAMSVIVLIGVYGLKNEI